MVIIISKLSLLVGQTLTFQLIRFYNDNFELKQIAVGYLYAHLYKAFVATMRNFQVNSGWGRGLNSRRPCFKDKTQSKAVRFTVYILLIHFLRIPDILLIIIIRIFPIQLVSQSSIKSLSLYIQPSESTLSGKCYNTGCVKQQNVFIRGLLFPLNR